MQTEPEQWAVDDAADAIFLAHEEEQFWADFDARQALALAAACIKAKEAGDGK